MVPHRGIVSATTQPVVYGLATTLDGTRTALVTAVPIAKGAQARLVVLVPHVVPDPSPADPLADPAVFTARRYEDLVRAANGAADVRVCPCRSPRDLVDTLPDASTVIVGGRSGSVWRTSDERLSRHVARQGHQVVFVATPRTSVIIHASALLVTLALAGLPAVASAQTAAAQAAAPDVAPPDEWHYGGFLDAAAIWSANSPSNHLFRNRGTTPRVGEVDRNMAAAYLKKAPAESSRVGLELTVQGGEDAKLFGFSATAPNIDGADVLRHLGPANVSYLAPVGKGLTVQGGIFSSLIGYDSLYAKDNFTYTRPWTADYTPYLMLGINVAYPVTPRLTATAVLVNGYWHLANANRVPSVGGQLAYQASDRVTVKETVLYGPHQTNTALEFWRFFSDAIVERKVARVTLAAEYQFGSEGVDAAGTPRAQWMAAQFPLHWIVRDSLSATVRPEVAWDRDGRWIGAPQSVTALTATLDYRVPLGPARGIVRVEYRFDDSRGAGAGFFDDGERTGVVGLTPRQHLLGAAVIVAFDGTFRR